MKLLTYGAAGLERPALLDANGDLRDLSDHITRLDGSALAPATLAKLQSLDPLALPKVTGTPRIGPCVQSVGKMVCIGKNYADHASEMGGEPPAEPLVFQKATSCICGPNDDVEVPRGSVSLDYEVELLIVIGTDAKYIEEANAMDHVAGFATSIDMSERDFQIRRAGQFTKGKSHDTFGPIGPYMVTKDDVADPHALRLWTKVDGEIRQDGNTKDLIFNVPVIVSYLSQFMTLNAGDIIATGTPSGVAAGMKPEPKFLKIGQILEVGIDGLGSQKHLLVDC